MYGSVRWCVDVDMPVAWCAGSDVCDHVCLSLHCCVKECDDPWKSRLTANEADFRLMGMLLLAVASGVLQG